MAEDWPLPTGAGGKPSERSDRLREIADFLIEVDADVVVLNEVDFDASWSGHLNQAEFLASRAKYPYRVEQRNLDFRVLGWTWRFGNAGAFQVSDYTSSADRLA